MGNHSSSSAQTPSSSEDKLLRRNKRCAIANRGPRSPQYPLTPNSFPAPYEARQNRSRSLEPQCAEAVRVIEHSQSARYPRGRRPRHAANFLSAADALSSDNDTDGQLDSGIEVETSISLCITGLTHHQKMILQKVWMRAGPQEILESSRTILAHLIRSNPVLYDVFHLPSISESELSKHAIFAKLAANFATVFDFVMTNLVEDLDKVCYALQSLGGHHTELTSEISPTMWVKFQRAFDDNPPKAINSNAGGPAAWKLMIAFIVRQMRIGYSKSLSDREAKVFGADDKSS
uniref:GLOBIN domain-containing protein n=1 Tax=Panagrellus redivivus TaxID=6233 RepID=A0A7E4VCV6_PANRE